MLCVHSSSQPPGIVFLTAFRVFPWSFYKFEGGHHKSGQSYGPNAGKITVMVKIFSYTYCNILHHYNFGGRCPRVWRIVPCHKVNFQKLLRDARDVSGCIKYSGWRSGGPGWESAFWTPLDPIFERETNQIVQPLSPFMNLRADSRADLQSWPHNKLIYDSARTKVRWLLLIVRWQKN